MVGRQQKIGGSRIGEGNHGEIRFLCYVSTSYPSSLRVYLVFIAPRFVLIVQCYGSVLDGVTEDTVPGPYAIVMWIFVKIGVSYCAIPDRLLGSLSMRPSSEGGNGTRTRRTTIGKDLLPC